MEEHLQPWAPRERVQKLRRELIAFVAQEEAKARPYERLLGSSDLVESVLGKLKRLEREQEKSGFTGLGFGVRVLVSTRTPAVIQEVLETVPTQQV